MNLSVCYRLAPGVAIRRERFGGLVYRYDNRRLYVLHSHDVVNFVSGLDSVRPLGEALDDFLASRGFPEASRETLVKAIARLEELGILDRA